MQSVSKSNQSGETQSRAISRPTPKLIGQILHERGLMSEQAIKHTLSYSRVHGVRFGDGAKALNVVSDQSLDQALAEQFDYPFLKLADQGVSKELLLAYDPFGERGEAIRQLRNRLLLLRQDDRRGALMVVSPDNASLSSWISANLAIAFSQLGNSCLLIDGNLKQPEFRDWFGITTPIGLSSYLVNRAPISGVIHKMAAYRELYVLPAGVTPPNPLEILSRPEMQSLMVYASNRLDVTIINASPFSADLNPAYMAKVCQNVLVVTQKNRSRFDDVRNIKKTVESVGGKCVGAVVVDRPRRSGWFRSNR